MAIKGFRMKPGTNMQNNARVEIYARCPKHPKKMLWVWQPIDIVMHGGECEECGGEPTLVGVHIKPDLKTNQTAADVETMLCIFEGMTASVRDRGAVRKDVADAMISRSREIRKRLQ